MTASQPIAHRPNQPLPPAVPSVDRAAEPVYSTVAMALHWLLALWIVGLFALGVYMHELPFSPQRLKLFNWHKWAGIAFLALTALRLLWRLTHRPPALPARIVRAMPAWQAWAHHATHHALYALFFVVPLLGWAYSSAAGFPIVWLGVLPLPDWVSPNPALADVLKPLHQAAALALMGLAGLHVAAALKHQWLDRDDLLARMRPRR